MIINVTFGGRIYFIAITYDRKKINNKTVYKTVWMTVIGNHFILI